MQQANLVGMNYSICFNSFFRLLNVFEFQWQMNPQSAHSKIKYPWSIMYSGFGEIERGITFISIGMDFISPPQDGQ